MFFYTFTLKVSLYQLHLFYLCSYSYDLTHSLQYNLSPDFGLPSKFDMKSDNGSQEPNLKNDDEDDPKQENEIKAGQETSSAPNTDNTRQSGDQKKSYRGKPCEMFIWNIHLLSDFREQVHPDWILNVIHGFVGQSSILSKAEGFICLYS